MVALPGFPQKSLDEFIGCGVQSFRTRFGYPEAVLDVYVIGIILIGMREFAQCAHIAPPTMRTLGAECQTSRAAVQSNRAMLLSRTHQSLVVLGLTVSRPGSAAWTHVVEE